MATKKNIKVRDLKPKKDAKGGSGVSADGVGTQAGIGGSQAGVGTQAGKGGYLSGTGPGKGLI
jgi:hypothetical protein